MRRTARALFMAVVLLLTLGVAALLLAGCSSGSDTATTVETATPTAVKATIDVGAGVVEGVVLPDGSAVYVPNNGSDTVSVIDTDSNAVTTTIDVGRAPLPPVVLPDSSAVYVSNYGSDMVSVVGRQ